MELILTSIELNEDFIANQNATYDVWFSKKLGLFIANLADPKNERKMVGFEDLPKRVKYTLDKPLNDFTDEEIKQILDYRGLNVEADGFEIGDVFMEKSFITLLE